MPPIKRARALSFEEIEEQYQERRRHGSFHEPEESNSTDEDESETEFTMDEVAFANILRLSEWGGGGGGLSWVSKFPSHF